MNPEDLKKYNEETLKKGELASMKPISFDELHEVFDKWMLIPDRGFLKFLCGYACAHHLSGKAIWAFIVAPSGGGKTEMLNSLLDLPWTTEISSLTVNTFLSGMPGPQDASLLPKIDGKIAIFKDWTTILSMQKDAKSELYSQFREIWDGGMVKAFGNGKIRTWKGKVSILAASTQAIDINQQQYTHLGERFINYRPLMPDRKEVAMRSLDNDADQVQMGKELKNAVYAFFKGIDFEKMKDSAKLSHETRKELVNLANFCTMARSGVIRDFGMKKEVIFVPAAEMPTRIVQQLNALATGIKLFRQENFDDNDMAVIYKCALDSIPSTNKMVIIEMARANEQTTAEIATALGYPTDPIKMYLENLALLKVCKRIKDGGRADKWLLDEEFATVLRKYENIEMLTEDEIKERRGENEEEIESDNSSLDNFVDELNQSKLL